MVPPIYLTLETKRLILRPFTLSDLDEAARLHGDPESMVWSLDGTLDRAQTRAKLHERMACQESHGFSKLAVFEKGCSGLIGYCGFAMAEIDGRPQPELGYRLKGSARGRGLASEAVGAVLSDAFTRLKMPYVLAFVDEKNAASRRVLAKMGFAYEKPIAQHGQPFLLYRLPAPKA